MTVYSPDYFSLVPPSTNRQSDPFSSSQLTYNDLMKNPDGHCIQCVFSGGKFSSSEKNVKSTLTDGSTVTTLQNVNKCKWSEGYDKELGVTPESKLAVGRKIKYKDLFDDINACGTHHVGSVPGKDAIGHDVGIKNCVNTYSEKEFIN